MAQSGDGPGRQSLSRVEMVRALLFPRNVNIAAELQDARNLLADSLKQDKRDGHR